MTDSILARWSITASDLTQIIDDNPSLRGFLLGYVGEFQLRKMLLADSRLSKIRKYDDHDRLNKNDLAVSYQGFNFTVEVKSLQTRSIRRMDGSQTGNFQCDASDSRMVTLPDGTQLKTTCLVIGEFDIVAVNLFAFRSQWDFAFALNRDLPLSTYRGYTAEQRRWLLATSMQVTWPLQAPFVIDPFVLLDQLVKERLLISPS